MTTATTITATWTARGLTDDVTTCEICGKPELKGTVRLVLVDGDGNDGGEVYAGVTCAARRAGRKAAEIRTEAQRADRGREAAVVAAYRAWSNAESDWFCAQRDAALGRDCGFAAIVEFHNSYAHKAAHAEWLAANPRVAYAKRRRELLEQYGTTDPATLRLKIADLWDVVAAEIVAERCGRCLRPFDSDVPSGRADLGRSTAFPAFCNGCVSRCHESADFAHVCVICRAPDEAL